MLLRAVRFLDTMIQRDNLQKAAFLKDLGAIWPRVDARVLKFRMIPPLLAEARTEALQPVLLPLLLSMVEKQDDEVGTQLPDRSKRDQIHFEKIPNRGPLLLAEA